MELSQQGLLDDIPARSLTKHIFNNNTFIQNELIFKDNGCKWNYSSYNFQTSNQNPSCPTSNYSFFPFSAPQTTYFHQHSSRYYPPSFDHAIEIAAERSDQSSSYENKETIYPVYQDHGFTSIWPGEDNFFSTPYHFYPVEAGNISSYAGKVGMEHSTLFPAAAFNMGLCDEIKRKKSQPKKLQGQPFSKNLMAERRRRKRLNDRLSMLRSIVPRVSKMDRTSILGDTIEYIRELIEKINRHEEEMGLITTNIETSILRHQMPTEPQIRSQPKIDAARRRKDIHVDICCANKPGFLLSSLSTLESFGLEIQKCVISSFNEFSMQATSLQQEVTQQREVTSEDIKQVLLRNAGYSGRCM